MDLTKEEMCSRFWKAFDHLLEKDGLSLSDVAENTGIRYQTITGWRTNKRLPDLFSAMLISEFLTVPVEFLCLPEGFGVAFSSAPRFLARVASGSDEEKADAARLLSATEENSRMIGEAIDKLLGM